MNTTYSQMIVGVDNGVDGGFCAISRCRGCVISKMVMPTLKRNGKSEVDLMAVKEWVNELNTEPCFVIEEPLHHAKSSQAVRSMAINFGKLLGACEMRMWEVNPITVREWQKEMLGTVPKGKTKEVAKDIAMMLCPGEDWTRSERAVVPHDGMIDAYLIAEYWRKKSAFSDLKEKNN